jgi:hypothetical protein
MVLIRDLSVYDSPPVPYADYDGLIIRCFNGSFKDAKFDLHKAGAKLAGKPWWPYMFYNFLYPALPQMQAVLAILQGDSGNLPLAIDVEQWGGHQFPARDILLDNLQILYATYHAAIGKAPFYYLNPAAIHYLKPIPGWLANCPLWVAHWGTTNPDYEPWPRWTFQQYQGDPDYSRFNGTDAEYWEYVNGVEPPLPSKVKVTATVLNIRKAPEGLVIGSVPKGTILGVTGMNGKWYQSGPNAYFASWWTEVVE